MKIRRHENGYHYAAFWSVTGGRLVSLKTKDNTNSR